MSGFIAVRHGIRRGESKCGRSAVEPKDVKTKLLKRKDQETGIEPATSSLGSWYSIDNKEFGFYCVDF